MNELVSDHLDAVETQPSFAPVAPVAPTPVRRSPATEMIASAAPAQVTNNEALLRRIFGEPGRRTDETGVVQQLMDQNVAGVAVFAQSGELLFANGAYQRFDLPSGLELRERYRTSNTGVVRIRQDLVSSTSVKVVELDGGFSIITDPVSDRLGIRDKAFGYLLDPSLADEDILRRTALALGRASGWRWIGVSQFDAEKPGTVHFRGWWDAAELRPDFDLDVAGTACGVVVDTGEFCYYDGWDELRRRFPDWGWVDEYPVKSYAGLAYKVDGAAAGHIVAMHDESGTSREVVEDLLRLFSHFVGVHLELEQQRDRSKAAKAAALIDELTGLGNRRAYNEHLAVMKDSLESGAVDDVLLVFADLDNLEHVNDQHGRDAGDRYIKSYAEVIRKMWRPTDHFFRLDGDQYAMVITGITPGQMPLVRRRLTDGAEDLRKAVNLEGVTTDVSYGMAFASEHGGDLRAVAEAADATLLKMKKTHRARAVVREQIGR